jgi:hypothetical protein
MTTSRHRNDKKRAGEETQPGGVTDAEVRQRIDEVCRPVRQQNKALSEQLQRQRTALLEILPSERFNE